MFNSLFVLIVLALAGTASAAAAAAESPQLDLPACSKGCLDGSKAPMCSDKTDKACFCRSEAFMRHAEDCSKSACSAEDFNTAKSVGAIVCGASTFPACAQACLDGPQASTCTKEDKGCRCNNETFIASVKACAVSACSLEDFEITRAIAMMVCGPLRTSAASSMVASTTPSTTESPSASSPSPTPTSDSLALNAAQVVSVSGIQVYAAIALAGLLALAL